MPAVRLNLAVLALCVPAMLAAAVDSFLPETSAFIGYETRIPMRDGAELAADVFIPKGEPTPRPVILIQTPYNKLLNRALFEDPTRTPRGPLFTDTSFAFVVTDWRDRFASKEAARPGIQAGAGQDGFDTAAWVAKQDFCNGKIGTWGPSALGAVQFRTAAENPPNLVCAVPMVMPLNLEHHIYFHGGVLWEEFVKRLGTLGWDLYGQLKEHPDHDAYWRILENRFIKPENIQVPLLMVGGWYDIYVDSVLETFQTLKSKGSATTKKESKLIVGPWLHRTGEIVNGALEFPMAEHYDNKRAQAYFRHWLLGEASAFNSDAAPITYFQMGTNEWRGTDAWPPKGVVETAYYLRPDRGLAATAPASGAAFAEFQYDPANPAPTVGGHVLTQELNPGPQDQRERVESRGDVIVFTSDVLDRDLVVAGGVKMKAFVSTDKTDTDFSAILTDVYPDGRSILVCEGIQRLRYREGTAAQKLATPGAIYAITIALNNTAQTFLKGHRIRVIVSSSNYPKYAKNLNDGGPMYVDGRGEIATNRIYHDADHPSALILPVLGE